MTAMVHEAELRRAAGDAVGAPFTDLFQTVLSRAVRRGDTPPSVDVSTVAEVFPALAFHRGAALGLAVDDEFVDRVVDHVLLPLLRR